MSEENNEEIIGYTATVGHNSTDRLRFDNLLYMYSNELWNSGELMFIWLKPHI